MFEAIIFVSNLSNIKNAIVSYYPQNNIYIQNDDKYKEVFTTFTHDKKLYLINAYCYNKRAYPGIQLALKLKNKDSIIYSALLSALKEINDGECKYIISKGVCNKIIKIINLKSCINQINICKYFRLSRISISY